MGKGIFVGVKQLLVISHILKNNTVISIIMPFSDERNQRRRDGGSWGMSYPLYN